MAHLQSNKGKIIVITGPMFASKSTTLIGFCQKYKIAKKSLAVITYVGDTRYTDANYIVSHDLKQFEANYLVKQLQDIPINQLEKYDILLIDEGQFLSDLLEFFVT